MNRDINFLLETKQLECFACKKKFTLYSIQETSINFCKVCSPNFILVELFTLPNIIKKIVDFAEKRNIKDKDKLLVDVSELINKLQE